MAGQYGTEQLEKIAVDVAKVVVNAEKGGLVGGFGILSTLSDLKDLDLAAAAREVKELDAEDRAKVKSKFDASLVLANKALEAKIEGGLDLVDAGFVVVAEALETYKDALAVYEKAKALVS
jgi:hypothetical protein